jgi:hypothetical protein
MLLASGSAGIPGAASAGVQLARTVSNQVKLLAVAEFAPIWSGPRIW